MSKPAIKASLEPLSGRVANEVIRCSDEPLQLLINGIKDYAIILLDPRGRIVTWNEGARRLIPTARSADRSAYRILDASQPAEAVLLERNRR